MDFILISVFLPRNSVAVWLLTDLLLSQSAIFTFRFPLGLIWVEVGHLNPDLTSCKRGIYHATTTDALMAIYTEIAPTIATTPAMA